jgi:hypothetical protein
MVWVSTVAQLTGLQAVATCIWVLKGLVFCTMASSLAAMIGMKARVSGWLDSSGMEFCYIRHHALTIICIGLSD